MRSQLWRMPRTVPGQLLTSLLGGVLILGHAGCVESFTLGSPNSTFGVFLNTDTASDVLGAIRLASGESAFVFGAYEDNGQIREITGAVLVNALGQEASVKFENGRLSQARSYDGSTIDVAYDAVTETRLAGRVDLYVAAAPAADQHQTIAFDIDLSQTAAEVADAVWRLLGVSITDEEPPDASNAKERITDRLARKDNASQVVLFAAFHVSAFAAIGYAIVQIVTGIVDVVMQAVVGLVVGITRVVVAAVFTPFMVLGDVLRGAVENPVITLDFDIEFSFDVPRRP